jgi:hypothetical protein
MGAACALWRKPGCAVSFCRPGLAQSGDIRLAADLLSAALEYPDAPTTDYPRPGGLHVLDGPVPGVPVFVIDACRREGKTSPWQEDTASVSGVRTSGSPHSGVRARCG